MSCGACFAWNLPLVMPPRMTPHAVGLTYEQWLLYRLHVEMHQHGNWSGEIEQIAPMLALNPSMTLDPLGMAA